MHRDFVLKEHHRRLLHLPGEAWDQSQQARMMIGAEGAVFKNDRGNACAHPAIGIEKDAGTEFARLIRELELGTKPPASTSRPLSLRSNRRSA